MGATKYNWKAIEKDYVEGIADDSGAIIFPTQRDLADKYGPTPANIGHRAKKEQWLTKREIYSSKIAEMRQQKSAEAISDEGSDFDLTCFNIATEAAEKIRNLLSETDTPKNVSLLTASLKNVQSVAKAALGDNAEGNQDLTIHVSVEGDSSANA
jgi:hypothetical protein